MCLVDYNTHQPSEHNTCTAAAAYMEACGMNSIPIKIPSYCVQYAMVVYGGEPPFSMPVVATVNNQIFTDAANIDKALDHVTFSKYSYS
ncbi:hypothetical protein E2C01_056999 [Portunus trituberculatus]|uniref:Uncharacterized protein n=1 Tax=Portunus trituberculatus TaxID=210409 RepID=A0A5B7H149_PORTR|nr:hypothetical protein [Portunus trituberculatus]